MQVAVLIFFVKRILHFKFFIWSYFTLKFKLFISGASNFNFQIGILILYCASICHITHVSYFSLKISYLQDWPLPKDKWEKICAYFAFNSSTILQSWTMSLIQKLLQKNSITTNNVIKDDGWTSGSNTVKGDILINIHYIDFIIYIGLPWYTLNASQHLNARTHTTVNHQPVNDKL